MKRHGALSRVQHKQLGPAEAQEGHLVGDLQLWEERDVAGPFYGGEEQARGQLADVLDAHNVRLLHAVPEPGGRVGFCPQQHGDEAGQVGVPVQGVAAVESHLGMERVLCGWDAASLNGFPPHAGLEAFLEAAVLALVAVVLVNRAVAAPPARIGEVPADTALEEALAALAGELTIVLAGALVAAHHTLNLLLVAVRHAGVGRARTVVVVAAAVVVATAATVVVVVVVTATVVIVVVVAAAVVMMVAVVVMMVWRGAGGGRWVGIHGDNGRARSSRCVAPAADAAADGVADRVMG